MRHHLVEAGCAADRAACVLHTAAATLIVVRCCCRCHSVDCSGFPSTIVSLSPHCAAVELRPFCTAPTRAARTRSRRCSSTPPSDQGLPSVSILPPSCSPRSGGEETRLRFSSHFHTIGSPVTMRFSHLFACSLGFRRTLKSDSCTLSDVVNRVRLCGHHTQRRWRGEVQSLCSQIIFAATRPVTVRHFPRSFMAKACRLVCWDFIHTLEITTRILREGLFAYTKTKNLALFEVKPLQTQ